MRIKRTKIICTIGPSTESYSSIKRLYKAGMNVARLNMSHSDHKNAKKIIDLLDLVDIAVCAFHSWTGEFRKERPVSAGRMM